VRRAGQLAGQLVFVRGVAGYDLEDEIVRAARHMALAHLRPLRHQLLEIAQHGVALAVQADEGEERHLEAHQFRGQFGVIAPDVSRLLQGAHAAQARRRGNPRALGEVHVGHAPVALQILEDFQVDPVESVSTHASFLNRRRLSAQ